MAQGTLVTDLIDSGTLLIRQLRLGGFPIAAAWWIKPIEDPLEGNQGWQFFLASSLMDQLGPADAYQKLHDILKNVSFDSVLARIPLGKIKILGETNPITQGVFKIIDQLHGVGPIRVWHRRLGEMRAEEIFIYALNLPSPWQRVILKNPVEVNEPSLKQSEALNQIMASGNPPVLAGWPKSFIPP